MSKTKSTTKDVSDLGDFVGGTKTYKTTISDGKSSVSNRGGSPEKSQEKASESWSKKKW